jgi:hypothetical protein
MARRFATASSQYFVNTGGSPVSTYPFSISAWYKPTVTLQDKAIFCLANGSSRHLLYQNQAKVAMFSGVGATTGQSVTSGGLTAGTLSHIGGIVSAANIRSTIIDGLANGFDLTNVVTTSMVQTYLGAYYNSGLVAGFYGNGDISEVGIWDVELNADEWASLGAGCSPLLVRPQNLKAYWPLLGRATHEEDWVGTYLLTNTNSATVVDHTRIIYPTSQRMVVSGTSSVLSYSYTATGGVSFSGASSNIKSKVNTPSGGVSFAGASTVIRNNLQSRVITASGGISFSGTSVEIRSATTIATGGLFFGGAASITLTPDPNPTSSRGFKRGRHPRFRLY